MFYTLFYIYQPIDLCNFNSTRTYTSLTFVLYRKYVRSFLEKFLYNGYITKIVNMKIRL